MEIQMMGQPIGPASVEVWGVLYSLTTHGAAFACPAPPVAHPSAGLLRHTYAAQSPAMRDREPWTTG